MPVMIKFYMVVGRDEPYESVIKSVINEVREKFKGSEKSINATFIRIKPEAVDAALNALNIPENQVPQNLIYLVKSMKQDGVKALPALIINGRKIYEGQLPPPDTVRQTVMDEVMALLTPTQSTPQPTAPQQLFTQPQSPTPTLPETKPTPPPQLQVERPSVEVKPLQRSVVEERSAPTVVAPIQPITVPSGVRVMIGRPNDCRECIYYGANTGTCLLFGYRVTDPSKPPCKS